MQKREFTFDKECLLTLRGIFVFGLGMAAVVWDFRTGKIPNPLIIAGLIMGAAWQWCMGGLHGTLDFLFGVLGTFLILAILHWFRMLGAGDIKLLMIMGGFLGLRDNLKCIYISFLIAAVISVAVLIQHRILKRRLKYFLQYVSRLRKTKKWEPYIKTEERESEQAYLHFSLPILLGALCVLGGWI